VISQCKQRHRHQEFLQFLNHIERSVPEELDIHLVVDNYATHKYPKVKRWLAARPRYYVHYTPTCASLLNQVDLFEYHHPKINPPRQFPQCERLNR